MDEPPAAEPKNWNNVGPLGDAIERAWGWLRCGQRSTQNEFETKRQTSNAERLSRLAIGAGGFGAARKIDEISQNIQRFIALGIDDRFFRVGIIAACRPITNRHHRRPPFGRHLWGSRRSFWLRPVCRDT